MKYLLLMLLLVACGGEPFSGESVMLSAGGDDTAAGAGGDAVPAVGGSASTTGGTSNTAGHASSGSAGTAATAATGGSAASCELDIAKLTALLPTTLTWDTFTGTISESCVTCRDKPCGTVKIISWGVPVHQGDEYIYYPNSDKPMMAFNFGDNDGSCTKQVECGSKAGVTGLIVTVARSGAGWKVTTAQGTTGFGSNACVEMATPYANAIISQMGMDFSAEFSERLSGLEFGCAE